MYTIGFPGSVGVCKKLDPGMSKIITSFPFIIYNNELHSWTVSLSKLNVFNCISPSSHECNEIDNSNKPKIFFIEIKF